MHNNFLLWEDDTFTIRTPLNPHLPYSEGLHLVVAPKSEIASAWEAPDIAAETFQLAAKACKLMESTKLAPWFNLQANGNWGLLPGKLPFFHIHIYGRNKTSTWGKPLVLPVAPGTFNNEPMPKSDIEKITEIFRNGLK